MIHGPFVSICLIKSCSFQTIALAACLIELFFSLKGPLVFDYINIYLFSFISDLSTYSLFLRGYHAAQVPT